MLGHSAVGVTNRHYAGVGEALGRQASDRLGELLRRPAWQLNDALPTGLGSFPNASRRALH